MISRFTDSLKKSASRAEEITKAPDKDKPRIFVEFIDGLKISAGCAHQLAHAQENPYFLTIRDTLEGIIEIGQKLPVMNQSQNVLWLGIKTSLETMSTKGQRMATSKAVTRTEVLANLDVRQKALDAELSKPNG